MTNTIIRAATLDDINELCVLNSLVQNLHLAQEPEVFRPVPHDAVTEWFRSCLQQPAIRV